MDLTWLDLIVLYLFTCSPCSCLGLTWLYSTLFIRFRPAAFVLGASVPHPLSNFRMAQAFGDFPCLDLTLLYFTLVVDLVAVLPIVLATVGSSPTPPPANCKPAMRKTMEVKKCAQKCKITSFGLTAPPGNCEDSARKDAQAKKCTKNARPYPT